MSSDLFVARSTDQVCHELLLGLAGRLPDELLWRLRDWLAAQSRAALAATLPRELLRHRIGLTETECELLATAAGEWGASRRLLDAVLPVDTPDRAGHRLRRRAGRGRTGRRSACWPWCAAIPAAGSCSRPAGARWWRPGPERGPARSAGGPGPWR